jgi:hypothetical protein
MTTLNDLLSLELSSNTEVREIQIELMKIWNKQEQKGLDRLSAAYRFFTLVGEDGEMVYSEHCNFVDDMRLGGNGLDDFNRFVNKHLDISGSHYSENMNDKAEKVANAYVKDQAFRLANFIVRIAPMEVSDD